MVNEEQKFANQGATWQRLFEQAQAAWIAEDYDLAGDYFSELREKTTPLMLVIATQKTRTSQAEDIVSEAHLELYRTMRTGKVVKNVGGLLRRIVERRAIDELRRAATKRERQVDDAFWTRYAEAGVATDNVEDDVTSRLATNGLVNDILDGLPSELRVVLVPRHGFGMSVEATALQLSLTEDQVKKRTREALAHAQAIAQKKGRLE